MQQIPGVLVPGPGAVSAPGSPWAADPRGPGSAFRGPVKSGSCKGLQLGLWLTLKYWVVCEAWPSGVQGRIAFFFFMGNS